MRSGTEVLMEYLVHAPLSLACVRAAEAEQLKKELAVRMDEGPFLDLCCGFGEFAESFLGEAVEHGVDIFREDVVRSKEQGKVKIPAVGDARALPYKDEAFSTLMSVSALEHIPEVNDALREANRVLVKGGCLIFTVPTIALNDHIILARLMRAMGLSGLARKLLAKMHKTFVHHNVWSSEEWIDACKDSGFEKVEMRPVMTSGQVMLHDLGMYPAFLSQCIRWVTGLRTIIPFPYRRSLCRSLYQRLSYGDFTEAVILVTATK